MMMFSIIAIDANSQVCHFWYRAPDLDTSLDFIHGLSTGGHLLQSVQLIDQRGLTALPLDTFAVLPSTDLVQLQAEWEVILSG